MRIPAYSPTHRFHLPVCLLHGWTARRGQNELFPGSSSGVGFGLLWRALSKNATRVDVVTVPFGWVEEAPVSFAEYSNDVRSFGGHGADSEVPDRGAIVEGSCLAREDRNYTDKMSKMVNHVRLWPSCYQTAKTLSWSKAQVQALEGRLGSPEADLSAMTVRAEVSGASYEVLMYSREPRVVGQWVFSSEAHRPRPRPTRRYPQNQRHEGEIDR